MILRSLLVLTLLSACSTPKLFGPSPEDPLDGFEGSLAEAGVNTEMDWGPGQGLLLSQYKTVQEENARLQARVEELVAGNKTLQASLTSEREALNREKGKRVQVEAEADQLRATRRDLEARILSLSIEKAKLEQGTLLARISELQRDLDRLSRTDEGDTATPPPGRGR